MHCMLSMWQGWVLQQWWRWLLELGQAHHWQWPQPVLALGLTLLVLAPLQHDIAGSHTIHITAMHLLLAVAALQLKDYIVVGWDVQDNSGCNDKNLATNAWLYSKASC